MEDRKWQKEAEEKFIKAGSGIIIAATGAGKTQLAINIFEKLNKPRTLVITPTTVIMEQWLKRFQNYNNISIGAFYGKEHIFGHVTMSVINSVSKYLNHEYFYDYDLIIFDEIHRYASQKFIKVIKHFKEQNKKMLGLTATLNKKKVFTKYLIEKLGGIIYEYHIDSAIKDNILCKYDVYNIKCKVDESTQEKYKEYSNKIKELLAKYDFNLDIAIKKIYQKEASELLNLIQKRKQLFNLLESKKEQVKKIIAENPDSKILIFNELNIAAEKIYKELKNAVYITSEIPIKKRKKLLEDFKTNKNILITSKIFDEGFNLPELDIIIIVSGTQQKRQMLQRVGRALRKKEHNAKIFQLYADVCYEKKIVAKRTRFLKQTADNIYWK